RRRHTRSDRDWSSDVCSSDLDVLRANGYQFVSVSDLIGKTRAEVMLPLSAEERFEARADGFIFSLYQWFRFFIGAIFILGIVLVDRKSTRLNSSHDQISYAVFCLKKKKNKNNEYNRLTAMLQHMLTVL